MLALFLLAAEMEPVNINAANPPTQTMDWSGNTPAEKADLKANGFDPNASILNAANMCVIINGQPLPDCANPNQPISLSDDIFGTNIGGADSTCQTIETLQKDANGNIRKVFATSCGDEVMRSDFKYKQSPTSANLPTQATDRAIGPNEIGSLN